MTSPDWFLMFGALSLFATACVLLRLKHLRWLMLPYFFIAWLTGELAVFHIALQALVALSFLLVGALQSGAGIGGLLLCLISWAGLYYFHRQGLATLSVHEQALVDGLGSGYRASVAEAGRPTLPEVVTRADWIKPFAMRKPGVQVDRDIAYGDAGIRHQLDIYRPPEASSACPVLLQIHGGGWMVGSKERQALPLMNHLASRGWVCVSVNYQLSPGVKFPQHLIDVKRALAWVRLNIADYGGDPNFVVVTGGSAGGHLSSLVALTSGRSELQPGFEEVDTSVAACVPFYGVYDFLDRHRHRGVSSMTEFLEDKVMPVAPEEDPELWDLASPITQVRADTPPFFVLNGSYDSMAFVEETRQFVEQLRAVSEQPVVYAELPLTQHAFEVFHSPRADNAVFAVTRFVETLYADYLLGTASGQKQ